SSGLSSLNGPSRARITVVELDAVSSSRAASASCESVRARKFDVFDITAGGRSSRHNKRPSRGGRVIRLALLPRSAAQPAQGYREADSDLVAAAGGGNSGTPSPAMIGIE